MDRIGITRLKNDTITLYDLQLESGCTIGPFVWRTKYALKHKDFDIGIVPSGFTGAMERVGTHVRPGCVGYVW